MLVSTEKLSIWRKVIGQRTHRRPTICSWNYKLIKSDTESSNQVKTVKTKCYILNTSLGQGNTRSIKQLWTKLRVEVLLLWLLMHAVLQGTVQIKMREKHQQHPYQQSIRKPNKANNSCCTEGLLYLPWISFLPSILIKPLVYLPSTLSRILHYILKVSWLPISHSQGQLFPRTQTPQASRLLCSTVEAFLPKKIVNIYIHILNNLRTT